MARRRSSTKKYAAGPAIPKGTKRIDFNSIQEMYDYVSAAPADSATRHETYSNRFCPFTFDESLENLIKGYLPGIAAVEIAAEKIQKEIDGEMSSYQFDVNGSFFDVGLFNAGVPECWLYEDRAPVTKNEVELFINCGNSMDIDAETIVNRGACLLSLIDELTRENIVNIHFYSKAHKVNDYICEVWLHLNTNNGYSRESIAFILCNPGYLRRLVFTCRERLMDMNDLSRWSYGSSQNLSFSDIPAGAMHFQKCEENIDIKQAAAIINNTLARYKEQTGTAAA